MLGNAAIARGAYEAGVRVAAAYPGTPSTEITEIISGYSEVYAEWSPNEKVALETALGASMAGVRALVCMKHVGVNVAADPLFTASYTGVSGGLVLVAADDPGMFSSQNEQDTRFYARAAHIPLLEPSDSAEAKEFTKIAFELSEKYDTPVILRTTTRLAHGQSYAEIGEREEREPILYVKNPAKYVMMPLNAQKRHIVVEKRTEQIAEDTNHFVLKRGEGGESGVLGEIACGKSENNGIACGKEGNCVRVACGKERVSGNTECGKEGVLGGIACGKSENGAENGGYPILHSVEYNDRKVGIVCSGIVYQYVKEALPNVSVLKLGMVYPLPLKLIKEFADNVAELIVAEELEPFIENQLKANGIACRGKSIFSKQGELSVDIVAEKLFPAYGKGGNNAARDINADGKEGTGKGNDIISGINKTDGKDGTGNAECGIKNGNNIARDINKTEEILKTDQARDSEKAAENLPGRPPVLCAGCPHRGVFYVLNKLRMTVCGDIGCYTLGALPPLSAVDSVVCMGAGIGMAHGFLKALPDRKNVVAVIGDSTFIHSGITGLIDSVYNEGRVTVVILDNSTTGMTGHQNHPATGKTIRERDTVKIDLETLCRACGVNRVSTVAADDIDTLEKMIREETERNETSVIIARKPCELIVKQPKKPYYITAECKKCAACMRIGCPAIKNTGKGIEIDAEGCVGCGLCQKLCRFGAILQR
ncbi:MAG: 4Fe-4S binding protein [Clostridiales bacterium]|nr:4Fe-4S binding protein [Clostridiales bacterium]